MEIKFSEKHKQNISKANKGRKLSESYKKKLSERMKGKNNPSKRLDVRKKISKTMKGRKFSEETLKKMSKARKGKYIGSKNKQWLGGISFEPYGLEFNEDLKEVVRNRDRRKCVFCEKTELEECKKLSVHHIDYDKKNNNTNNLIYLCNSCHNKTNKNRDYW